MVAGGPEASQAGGVMASGVIADPGS